MADIGKDGDLRHKFLEDRIGTALGAKGSRHSAAFSKLINSEETNRHLVEFINTPEAVRVFVTEGPKDLICFDAPPKNQKKKMVYFLKLQKVALTAENISEVRSKSSFLSAAVLGSPSSPTPARTIPAPPAPASLPSTL